MILLSRMLSGDSSVPPTQLPTTGKTSGTGKTTGKVMTGTGTALMVSATGTGKVTGTGSLLLSTESKKPP